jgi:large subunit ribosomal protein LP1
VLLYIAHQKEMAAFEGLSTSEKEELVVSLSALLCADAGAELSADNLSAVIAASGNSVADQYVPVYASVLEKAGGVEKYLQEPGAGTFSRMIFLRRSDDARCTCFWVDNNSTPFFFSRCRKVLPIIVRLADMFRGLSSGGGGGGGGAAEEKKEEEEEEEEEVDMGGGMDMFGGDEGGGDDY